MGIKELTAKTEKRRSIEEAERIGYTRFISGYTEKNGIRPTVRQLKEEGFKISNTALSGIAKGDVRYNLDTIADLALKISQL